ncbi:glycosyl transferase family 2 [Brevibacillus sp. AG162]|uniref:glycosyltransferase family 2 protein n=1 Tax=Brevibacillus sp. AG162 TaxID=2572910 RepID=UPI0011518CA4|nr:glycosyltransferase family 2 protein [Brevibacillus sp. AG162]TQK53828.1 glycosyl transferase family 2 [Brevibacillus sp. AG162]
MSPPLLSLCMIVKDEADQIEACLSSVHMVVDEIIVVDTGSTDGTQDICRKYGAKVLEIPWENSFAKARNAGLQVAKGEWILWLDADEIVQEEKPGVLRQAVSASKGDAFFMKMIHYTGSQKEQASRHSAYRSGQIRLFRNKKGFRFVRDIHEVLQWPATVSRELAVPLLPVHIHHLGYMDDAVQRKQKALRNLRLLRHERKQSKQDPWCDYHLANEFFRAKQLEHAFTLVNQAMKGFLTTNQPPPSICYKLKFDILFQHGSMRGAWPGIARAIQIYPNYVDLHFYKGVFLMEHGLYAEAIKAFEHCLEIGDNQWEHFSEQGMGSFYAFHFLGRCMERMGKEHESLVYDYTASSIHASYFAQKREVVL